MNCKLCRKDFIPTGRQIYCSPLCRATYHNRKHCNTLDIFDIDSFKTATRKIVCAECKKEFNHPRRTKFCSRYCRTKHGEASAKKNAYAKINSSPERYLSYKYNCIAVVANSKRRKWLSGLQFTIKANDLIDLWNKQNGKCALTGFPMTYSVRKGYQLFNASVDRIDNAVGYEPQNIRLTCRFANQMKFKLSDQELLTWCKAIIQTIEQTSSTTIPNKPTQWAI